MFYLHNPRLAPDLKPIQQGTYPFFGFNRVDVAQVVSLYALTCHTHCERCSILGGLDSLNLSDYSFGFENNECFVCFVLFWIAF